jgi:hypothetical protein
MDHLRQIALSILNDLYRILAGVRVAAIRNGSNELSVESEPFDTAAQRLLLQFETFVAPNRLDGRHETRLFGKWLEAVLDTAIAPTAGGLLNLDSITREVSRCPSLATLPGLVSGSLTVLIMGNAWTITAELVDYLLSDDLAMWPLTRAAIIAKCIEHPELVARVSASSWRTIESVPDELKRRPDLATYAKQKIDAMRPYRP